MLHLLQPNIPNRMLLLIKLMGISLLLHVMVGALFLYNQMHAPLPAIIIGCACIDLADVAINTQTKTAAVPLQQAPPKIQPTKSTKAATCMHNAVPLPQKKPVTNIKTKPSITKPLPVAQKKIPEQKKIIHTQQKKSLPVAQEVQKKSVNQKEYDALVLQQKIQEILQEYWQPPSGLATDLSCSIAVALDKQGKVKAVDFVHSSGVIMYDIHAQSTVMQARYPKETWGQQLTITFKQA